MADFDLEQLKSLMEALGDRLDKTQGDKLSREELNRIRVMLGKMANKVGKPAAKTSGARDSKAFIDDFFKEWKRQNPLRGAGGLGGGGPAGSGRRGTIVNGARAARQGSGEGNTILDREMRKAGQTAKGFGRDAEAASKGLGSFSSRMGAASAAFAGISAGAGKMLKDMLGAGAERVDQYRSILASGEGSVSSMQDLGVQAAKASVTVDRMASAMAGASDGARVLGAVKWGQLNKHVNDLTRASGAMGLTQENLDKAEGEYLDLMKSAGRVNQLNVDDMAQGIVKMVANTGATATILGKTREEQLKANAELAKDNQLMSVLTNKGLSVESALNTISMANSVGGQGGKDALLDVLTTGDKGRSGSIVSEGGAAFAAINGRGANAIQSIGNDINNGKNGREFQGDAERRLKEAALANSRDKSMVEQLAILARFGKGSTQQAALDTLGFNINGRNLKDLAGTNDPTNQRATPDQRAGVGALQIDGLLAQKDAMKDALVTAVFNPMIRVYGPILDKQIIPNLIRYNQALIDGALSAEKQTGPMAALGTGITGVLAAVAGIGAINSVMSGGKTLGRVVRGGASFFRGGAGAAGGAAGAAGAAEGAGAAGLGAEAGALGLGAGALGAGGLVVGGLGLGVGGMWAGGKQIENRKGESFLGTGDKEKGFLGSRSTGYLTSIAGGAAGGALVGSAFGGVGAIPGAVIGGVVGLGGAIYNDWDNLTGSNTPQGLAQGQVRPVAMPSRPGQPADATGQRGRNALTADQISMKIMDSSERSATMLKMVKENGDRHTDLLREEILVLRSMSDRVTRLLEDGNKNTKSIADHSA